MEFYGGYSPKRVERFCLFIRPSYCKLMIFVLKDISFEREKKDSLAAAKAMHFVLTSNRPPQDWVPLFPDPVMANSALDRLAHHAHHVIMEGESFGGN